MLVHGEKSGMCVLQNTIKEQFQINTLMPANFETVVLNLEKPQEVTVQLAQTPEHFHFEKYFSESSQMLV